MTEELLKLTEVFFMALRGIRGGSIAVTDGAGSQYDFDNGSIDLIAGSVPKRLASYFGTRR